MLSIINQDVLPLSQMYYFNLSFLVYPVSRIVDPFWALPFLVIAINILYYVDMLFKLFTGWFTTKFMND